MANYTPHTEEEIAKMGLLEKGDYPFEVVTASEGFSKASNKFMYKLEVLIFGDSGDRKITDFIVPGSNFGDKKLFNFCKGAGLMPQYQAGTLTADLMVGRQGWARVDVEAGGPNPKGGNYPDKNKVAWYHGSRPETDPVTVMNEVPKREVAPPAEDNADSDVPF